MKREEILKHIVGLSHSQGFYGRLHHQLMILKADDPQGYEDYMQYLESKKFKDPVEMVIFFEEGE